MNVEETIAIIEALKLAGAVRFKSRAFEVELRQPGMAKPQARRQAPVARDVAPADVPPPSGNPEATKQVEDLIDLLKRRDDQIMDLVFPEGAGG